MKRCNCRQLFGRVSGRNSRNVGGKKRYIHAITLEIYHGAYQQYFATNSSIANHLFPIKVIKNLACDQTNSIILATRKDLDIATSEEGLDYYTRIKDVVERINLRSNDLEAMLADRYRRAISKPNFRTRLNPPRRSTLIPKSPKLDLSWKHGRKNYPKKSSMIGNDYQVLHLPAAGSHMEAETQGTST
jgi:hypothetical protein